MRISWLWTSLSCHIQATWPLDSSASPSEQGAPHRVAQMSSCPMVCVQEMGTASSSLLLLHFPSFLIISKNASLWIFIFFCHIYLKFYILLYMYFFSKHTSSFYKNGRWKNAQWREQSSLRIPPARDFGMCVCVNNYFLKVVIIKYFLK